MPPSQNQPDDQPSSNNSPRPDREATVDTVDNSQTNQAGQNSNTGGMRTIQPLQAADTTNKNQEAQTTAPETPQPPQPVEPETDQTNASTTDEFNQQLHATLLEGYGLIDGVKDTLSGMKKNTGAFLIKLIIAIIIFLTGQWIYIFISQWTNFTLIDFALTGGLASVYVVMIVPLILATLFNSFISSILLYLPVRHVVDNLRSARSEPSLKKGRYGETFMALFLLLLLIAVPDMLLLRVPAIGPILSFAWTLYVVLTYSFAPCVTLTSGSHSVRNSFSTSKYIARQERGFLYVLGLTIATTLSVLALVFISSRIFEFSISQYDLQSLSIPLLLFALIISFLSVFAMSMLAMRANHSTKPVNL